MNIRIQTGKGITGALRYVQGEGRDPKTGKLIELAAGAEGRAELIGGHGFGFEVTDEARAELARKMMEHLAQNQASRTRKCVQDCVTIELSWARGETPGREEVIEASRSALAAQGMGNAMALFYSHSDEDFFHVHIVASKINPDTRRAYDLRSLHPDSSAGSCGRSAAPRMTIAPRCSLTRSPRLFGTTTPIPMSRRAR
jgi:hypothetical protein